ncbi:MULTISPECIES: hypothetical protein [unclassified Staphylococcus]|uniref:hypothetical protein n=1 Tax=unclassified Staphylococcus TaxID=91994 RepID=UPI001FDA8120|nr:MULTISPECIES: hypothetical protein [unclassified Staphylococcus]
MKKVLFLLLASFLVLGACGNKEENKSEDKKETKLSSKESKKDDKQSDDAKDDKSEDEKSNQDTKQVAENESTQEPVQSQEQSQPMEQQPVQQEPTDQEKMEANAKVAKEYGYTGIPNGDAMSDVPVGQIDLPPDELASEEAKPEYQDVVETEEEADARMGLNE